MAKSVMGCVPVTLWMVVMHPCAIPSFSWMTCSDKQHTANIVAGAREGEREREGGRERAEREGALAFHFAIQTEREGALAFHFAIFSSVLTATLLVTFPHT